ncbi:SH3 type 3 domain protein [Sporocytophaga myxococcoides]|uniref:SH3 type 3 domain protein n=1 Tax=Sporocytophaga myxococcoides TaxID=153721 RepID=A0A098LGT3_9BACT|nr:hypothetical protein [Sporocytophaga myxococcoides]GAL86190.1 SH3 type 3 domain protein [Sporocytophaga myxococcoides]
MKIIKVFCLLLLIIIHNVSSQYVENYESALKCIKGTWQGENQIKEPFADLSSEFLIFNNNLILRIKLEESFYSVSRCYFQNISNKPNELTRINLDSINKNKYNNRNFYFTQSTYIDDYFKLKKNENKEYLYNIAPDFSCQDDQLVYFYGEYARVNNVPDEVIKFIIETVNRNKNDNLLIFINKKLMKVKSDKAYLYSSMKERTNSYIIKGDIVSVEEESDEWLKIKFFGKKIIEAWINRKDVE